MSKKHNYYGKSSVLDEAFVTLRTNIQFSEVDKKNKSLVITSSDPSDGKSSVAVRLCKSFAQTNVRVILVDCDLRNPYVGKVAKVDNNIGVTNVLVQHIDYKEAIIKDSNHPFLDYLLTGPIPPNPAELLGTEAMKALVKQLEADYDYVVFDSPPVGLLSDASILGTITDGVILVITQNETRTEDIKRAINRVEHVGGKIIGAVLNKVDITTKRGAKNYYNYY